MTIFAEQAGPVNVISIRSFRNSDVPAIVRLWNEHRAEAGHRGCLSAAILEVVILGRPFFTRENLLVATEDGFPVGYAHWMMIPAADPTVSVDAVIANIAVPCHQHQDEIARQLIHYVVAAARAQGATRMLVGQAPDYLTGYIGLECHGVGAGISESDLAIIRWVAQAGFEPERTIQTYGIHASTYRPIFDRELIALRRTAVVDRRRGVTDQPFRSAAAMSHMEVHQFIAHRRGGDHLARADVMVGDPEMLVIHGGYALVSHWESLTGSGDAGSAAVRLVLSSAIAELIAERTNQIKAIIAANALADARILTAVGFGLDQRGTIFARSIV